MFLFATLSPSPKFHPCLVTRFYVKFCNSIETEVYSNFQEKSMTKSIAKFILGIIKLVVLINYQPWI
jgi:hypothetical protein